MSTINNLGQFWWVKQYIEDMGYNVGHSLFSIGHFLWLLFIIISMICFIKFYKNASDKDRIFSKKILALIIFCLEYIKFLIVGFIFPNYISIYLPLHLCSVAGLCTMFEACFGNNKFIDQMWLFVFFPCGLMGLLSPSTSVPFFNFFLIHTYLFHGILVLYAIIKFGYDKVKPTYSGLLQSSLAVLGMGIPIYYLNKTFGTNYFIISDPSDFPLAQVFWNTIVPKFGEFGYAVSMFIFAFIIFNIIYLILIAVGYFNTRKKKKR